MRASPSFTVSRKHTRTYYCCSHTDTKHQHAQLDLSVRGRALFHKETLLDLCTIVTRSSLTARSDWSIVSRSSRDQRQGGTWRLRGVRVLNPGMRGIFSETGCPIAYPHYFRTRIHAAASWDLLRPIPLGMLSLSSAGNRRKFNGGR